MGLLGADAAAGADPGRRAGAGQGPARTSTSTSSPYSIYPLTTQLLISVFVAAQAPALISRDLRFRTITLYLARPARRTTYVLVRLASLTAATFLLIAAPLLLMYVGGLLADLPLGRETEDFLGALVGAAAAGGLPGRRWPRWSRR